MSSSECWRLVPGRYATLPRQRPTLASVSSHQPPRGTKGAALGSFSIMPWPKVNAVPSGTVWNVGSYRFISECPARVGSLESQAVNMLNPNPMSQVFEAPTQTVFFSIPMLTMWFHEHLLVPPVLPTAAVRSHVCDLLGERKRCLGDRNEA